MRVIKKTKKAKFYSSVKSGYCVQNLAESSGKIEVFGDNYDSAKDFFYKLNQPSNIDEFLEMVKMEASKYIIINDIDFIETKVYHVAGYSTYVVCAGHNSNLPFRSQRITLDVESNLLEISLHTVRI